MRFLFASHGLGSLLALTLSLTVASSTLAADWPQWRGPNRDGISAENDWKPQSAKVAWKVNVGLGFACMSVADGRLFTIGHINGNEVVFALDANTGKELWKFSYPCAKIANLYEGGPNSTPTVDGDRVYVVGKEGQLFCLDAAKGTKIWEASLRKELGGKTPEWGFSSSPLIHGDNLIVQGQSTAAFNKKTGKLAWKSDDFKPAYGSAVVFEHGGKPMIADLNSKALIVVDATTGRLVASTPWTTQYDTSAATPIVVGNQIFISTGYGKGAGLYEFTGSSLNVVYTSTIMANHMNSCVLREGHLYGVHGNSHSRGDANFACVEFATGKRKWSHKGLGVGSVTLAGDKLIILSDRGDLVIAAASPESYKELHRIDGVVAGRCWTPPIIANGKIYLRNTPGDLVCVEVK